MKITESHLRQIVREELQRETHGGRDTSWSMSQPTQIDMSFEYFYELPDGSWVDADGRPTMAPGGEIDHGAKKKKPVPKAGLLRIPVGGSTREELEADGGLVNKAKIRGLELGAVSMYPSRRTTRP